MSVLDKLASALGRNDEKPNVALAEALTTRADRKAISELAEALTKGSRAVQNDAIKVLYEIGERKPALIAPHVEVFFDLLASKNNRLVWGALSALDAVASVEAKRLHSRLKELLAAEETASVIGKDKTISILCKLTAAGFAKTTVPVLLELVKKSAVNQLPMYAEHVAAVIPPKDVAKFRSVVSARLAKVPFPAKRARLEKVLRKLAD
jgi:hypothetical protein